MAWGKWEKKAHAQNLLATAETISLSELNLVRPSSAGERRLLHLILSYIKSKRNGWRNREWALHSATANQKPQQPWQSKCIVVFFYFWNPVLKLVINLNPIFGVFVQTQALYLHWPYFLMIQEGLLRGQPSTAHRTSIKVEWVGVSAPFTLPGYIQGAWNPDLLWASWVRLSTGRMTGKGRKNYKAVKWSWYQHIKLHTLHWISGDSRWPSYRWKNFRLHLLSCPSNFISAAFNADELITNIVVRSLSVPYIDTRAGQTHSCKTAWLRQIWLKMGLDY